MSGFGSIPKATNTSDESREETNSSEGEELAAKEKRRDHSTAAPQLFSDPVRGILTTHSALITSDLTHHHNLVVNLLHSLDRSNRSIKLRLERFAFDCTRQRHLTVQHGSSNP